MSEKHSPYAALQNGEFRSFLAIRLLATIGFAIQFLIIEWKVWEVTQQAKYLAFVPLFEIIALIPFALFYSGRKVEELEKRSSLMGSLVCCVIIAGLVSWFLSDDFIQKNSQSVFLASIYGTMFFWGVVRSFYSPSAFALYSLILPKKLYANGATWNSSMWQIGAVMGPAAGGFLYALLDADKSLWVVVLLFLICISLLFSITTKTIHKSEEDGSSKLSKAMAGIQYIIKNKVIFSALFLDMIAVLFGGAVALLPIFIDHIIQLDSYYESIYTIADSLNYPWKQTTEGIERQIKAIGLGVLRAAPSIGAIISMIAIAYFPVNRNTGKILLICILLFGFSIIGFGLSDWFALSFLFLILSGIFDGVSVIIRSTILQLLTPDDMKSRVSSANSIFVGSSNEIGAFESGITAQWFGAKKAVVLGGLITVAYVTGNFFSAKTLRDFELKDVDLED